MHPRPTMLLLSSVALAVSCRPGPAIPQTSLSGVGGATDLASGPDGTLWVTHHEGDALYRCQGGACERVEGDWYDPFGVAANGSGDVCVAHHDAADPLTRRTRITCLRDGQARTELEGVGQGLRGLTITGDGLWAAAWHDTPAMGREGELLHVVDGEIGRRVPMAGWWPQHLVVHPEGHLLVSVWRTDGAGFSAGEIVRVDEDGRIEPFSDALEQPAGLAVAVDAVWAVDHAAGELVRLDADGQATTVREGLSSPVGLAVRGSSTLCIASSGSEPVQCISVQDPSGGTP